MHFACHLPAINMLKAVQLHLCVCASDWQAPIGGGMAQMSSRYATRPMQVMHVLHRVKSSGRDNVYTSHQWSCLLRRRKQHGHVLIK